MHPTEPKATDTPPSSAHQPAADPAFVARLRSASELLESVAANRALLAGLPEAERTRLLQAAGQVSRPNAVDRRRLVKATKRQRKAQKVQRAESVLAETGIRALRAKPVFTTPNVFPPEDFAQKEVEGDPDFRESALYDPAYQRRFRGRPG